MSERAIRRRWQKRREQTNDSSVCVCACVGNAKVKCKAVRETRQIERESEWERARSVMSFYSSKKNEIIADERESEAGRRRQRERGQRSPEQATATSAKE